MNYAKMLDLTQQNLSANFIGNNQKLKKMSKNVKNYEFKAKNTSKEDITLALITGTFPDLKEIQKSYPHIDAIVIDGKCAEVTGANAGEVTVDAKTGKSLLHLQNMISKWCMTVRTLEMVSMDKRNFQEYIEHAATSPFETFDLKKTRVADYLSPQQYDSNRVICENINVPLTPWTIVAFTIRAESEIDFALSIV
jgi:hypothetical protein